MTPLPQSNLLPSFSDEFLVKLENFQWEKSFIAVSFSVKSSLIRARVCDHERKFPFSILRFWCLRKVVVLTAGFFVRFFGMLFIFKPHKVKCQDFNHTFPLCCLCLLAMSFPVIPMYNYDTRTTVTDILPFTISTLNNNHQIYFILIFTPILRCGIPILVADIGSLRWVDTN